MKVGDTVQYRDQFTGKQHSGEIAMIRDEKVFVRNPWDRNSYTQVVPTEPPVLYDPDSTSGGTLPPELDRQIDRLTEGDE